MTLGQAEVYALMVDMARQIFARKTACTIPARYMSLEEELNTEGTVYTAANDSQNILELPCAL